MMKTKNYQQNGNTLLKNGIKLQNKNISKKEIIGKSIFYNSFVTKNHCTLGWLEKKFVYQSPPNFYD